MKHIASHSSDGCSTHTHLTVARMYAPFMQLSKQHIPSTAVHSMLSILSTPCARFGTAEPLHSAPHTPFIIALCLGGTHNTHYNGTSVDISGIQMAHAKSSACEQLLPCASRLGRKRKQTPFHGFTAYCPFKACHISMYHLPRFCSADNCPIHLFNPCTPLRTQGVQHVLHITHLEAGHENWQSQQPWTFLHNPSWHMTELDPAQKTGSTPFIFISTKLLNSGCHFTSNLQFRRAQPGEYQLMSRIPIKEGILGRLG